MQCLHIRRVNTASARYYFSIHLQCLSFAGLTLLDVSYQFTRSACTFAESTLRLLDVYNYRSIHLQCLNIRRVNTARYYLSTRLQCLHIRSTYTARYYLSIHLQFLHVRRANTARCYLSIHLQCLLIRRANTARY